MRSIALRFAAVATIAGLMLIASGCTPDKALDFGPVGEINTQPEDQISKEILKEFSGHEFVLGNNDRQADVRLTDWPPDRRVTIPFWLGINPLYPGFLRPTVGHIYVMSESILVRPLGHDEYLIRAGSKLFKTDTLFKATNTHYLDAGKMLPTVVRFVGTRVITVPRDAPATGTITIKVPVLREVSLPSHLDEPDPGYAKFETRKASASTSAEGS